MTVLQTAYTRGHVNGILTAMYAIKEYQSTGSWPISLENASVIDEWSGTPFQIAQGESHPVIYSVGVDQDDDGGEHHRDAKGWEAGVITTITDGDWVIWPPND